MRPCGPHGSRSVGQDFLRPIRASKVAASSAPMSALPVGDQIDQQIEGAPGLRRIDHRRGMIRVPEPDARANTRHN